MLRHQGVERIEPEDAFGAELGACIRDWSGHASGLAELQRAGFQTFTIDRSGRARDHHPSPDANDLSESFFREYAEPDGVWEQVTDAPACFRIRFKALQEPGTIAQAVLPVRDAGEPTFVVAIAPTGRAGA